MTLKASTRFKELILGPNSFETIFNGGRIVLYTGTQPTSPDMPIDGVAVGEVSLNGTPWGPGGASGGLTFERHGVWAAKPPAAAWVLRGLDTGAATWFRLYAGPADAGGLSYAHARLDGAMGTDFVLPSYTITPATSVHIQQFLLTLPPVTGA